jgi:hypothetical protein
MKEETENIIIGNNNSKISNFGAFVCIVGVPLFIVLGPSTIWYLFTGEWKNPQF